MKIVILDGYALNPGDISWESIESQGDCVRYDITEPEDTISRIGDAEIVFTNKTAITAEVLDKCKNVKFIGVLATGYNVVDIKACRDRGVIVTNVPTYGTKAVSQFAMALILELCHRIGEHSRSVKAGDWNKSLNFCYWLNTTIELDNKVLGIIGFGRIGQAMARIALSFGMKVIAYDNNADDKHLIDGVSYVNLQELYRNSDFISLHCPLTEENRGMINKEAIALMKDGVYIVNTARGPLINEQDLYEALESRKVAGAAVDVLSEEPPIGGNVLIDSEYCIVTPHIAWAAREARERLMEIAAENLRSFLLNKPINLVS